MRTSLVAIGNSRGVRIPKPLIEQCGLEREIEMSVKDGAIVLQAPRKVREGWDMAFAQMSRLKDDQLPDGAESESTWDAEEWQW